MVLHIPKKTQTEAEYADDLALLAKIPAQREFLPKASDGNQLISTLTRKKKKQQQKTRKNKTKQQQQKQKTKQKAKQNKTKQKRTTPKKQSKWVLNKKEPCHFNEASL